MYDNKSYITNGKYVRKEKINKTSEKYFAKIIYDVAIFA